MRPAALLLALSLVPPPALADEAGLVGTWALSTDEEALAAEVDAAIDRTVGSLPALFRPFARPSLRKAAVPCRELALRLEEAALTRRCDEEAPFVRRFDDRDPPITGSDGDTYRTTVRRGPGWVSLRFDGRNGGQTEHYAAQQDGSLRATMTIHSKHLPEPMTWVLSYRRASGG